MRHGIQRAYAELQNNAAFRNPYRDEYKCVRSGLVPISITRQMLQACPTYSDYSACTGQELDGDTVRSIVDQIDRRDAMLAFNNRNRGLGAILGKGSEIQKFLDETIELLERQLAP